MTLTPFSAPEQNKKYKITEFEENGLTVAVLTEVPAPKKLPSGSCYKFGLLDSEGNYFWFFLGKDAAGTRDELRTIFTSIAAYCSRTNIGKPFAYKIK